MKRACDERTPVGGIPRLAHDTLSSNQPRRPTYNCIAWAAGQLADWWWPLEDDRRTFWPPAAPRAVSLEAFLSAFRTLGYLDAADETIEAGFEKIALFASPDGAPTHAARQLPTGVWTSKLGQAEDIEHELRALEGNLYGTVARILKRRVP